MIHKLFVPILLSLGIFATFGREVIFANYFGASKEIEIFRLAFSI